MNDLLTYVVGPLVGGFTGWFFGKRGTDASALATEIANVRETLIVWKEQYNELKQDRDLLRQTLDKILQQNEEIKIQNRKLIARVAHLEKQNHQLLTGQSEIKNP